MVVGEAAVDLGEASVMLTGQALDQLLDDRACRAVPGVPADPVSLAVEALDQRIDISVEDVGFLDLALTVAPVALGGAAAQSSWISNRTPSGRSAAS